jgi:hypothetical protein
MGLDTPGENPCQQLAGRMTATSLTSLFPIGGVILELQPGCTWSLGENSVHILDERWWHFWRRTLLEGIISLDRARSWHSRSTVYNSFFRGRQLHCTASSHQGVHFLEGGQGLLHGCRLTTCSGPWWLELLCNVRVGMRL